MKNTLKDDSTNLCQEEGFILADWYIKTRHLQEQLLNRHDLLESSLLEELYDISTITVQEFQGMWMDRLNSLADVYEPDTVVMP